MNRGAGCFQSQNGTKFYHFLQILSCLCILAERTENFFGFMNPLLNRIKTSIEKSNTMAFLTFLDMKLFYNHLGSSDPKMKAYIAQKSQLYNI